jgi:NADH-quinone oxidoreductase subunit J
MMLNLDAAPKHKGWVRYLPFGVVVVGLLMVLMVGAMNSTYFNANVYPWTDHPANYSNVNALGNILYTQYVYPFELAAVLLLVAIIAAVSLVLRGRRSGSKIQNTSEQQAVRPEDRIRLIKMPRIEKSLGIKKSWEEK